MSRLNSKYFHKQRFAMSEEDLAQHSARRENMYKNVVYTLVKLMNDPARNMVNKLSTKDAFIRRQAK